MEFLFILDKPSREENLRGFPSLWRAAPRPTEPAAPLPRQTGLTAPPAYLEEEWRSVKENARRDLGHPVPVRCSEGARCKSHIVSITLQYQ